MISYAKDILRNLYVEYSMPISVYDSKESEDKVLICYIKSPFYLNKRPIKHCNVFESRIIAKTFYKLGYSVDEAILHTGEGEEGNDSWQTMFEMLIDAKT